MKRSSFISARQGMRVWCALLLLLVAANHAQAETETSIDIDGGILDQLYGLKNVTEINADADQIWAKQGTISITGKAINSNNAKVLGVFDAGQAPAAMNMTELFSYSGSGTSITPAGVQNISESFPDYFRWGANGDVTEWSSWSNDNDGCGNHMRTWRITGSEGKTNGDGSPLNTIGNYVIAWEDFTDNDFNDLVVEVKNAYPVPARNINGWFTLTSKHAEFSTEAPYQATIAADLQYTAYKDAQSTYFPSRLFPYLQVRQLCPAGTSSADDACKTWQGYVAPKRMGCPTRVGAVVEQNVTAGNGQSVSPDFHAAMTIGLPERKGFNAYVDLFAHPQRAKGSTCKIMPLGDSITAGEKNELPVAEHASYRKELFAELNTLAPGQIQFVGTQLKTDVKTNGTGTASIDPKTFKYVATGMSKIWGEDIWSNDEATILEHDNRSHEGHPGWNVSQGLSFSGKGSLDLFGNLNERLIQWLNGHDDAGNTAVETNPDIILLHVGTNNHVKDKDAAARVAAAIAGSSATFDSYASSEDLEKAIREGSLTLLPSILDEVNIWAKYHHPVTVLVASIIGPNETSTKYADDNVELLNVAVKTAIAIGKWPWITVHTVDQQSALASDAKHTFSNHNLMADQLHPNDAGYRKMANKWRDGLVATGALNACAPPP